MSVYRTVFISHAHADNERCASIVEKLRARGVDVWIDLTNAQQGHNLGVEIEQPLRERTAFVLMVTETSNSSYWVMQERTAYNDLVNTPTTRLVNGIERMMLPVRLSGEVPVLLRGILWIDALNQPDEMVADKIAAALAIAPASPVRVAAPISNPSAAASPSLAPGGARSQTPQPATPYAFWRENGIAARLYDLGYRGWQNPRTGASFILPPLCAIDAGAFLMGSAEQDAVLDEEKPQSRVPVEAFAIGAFPVTVAEYACYIAANPAVAVPPGDDNSFYGWKQQQTYPDYPVIMVSWYNARDYMAWLARATGQPWRLPTEAEWEKAAHWDTATQRARRYPWGDTFDPSRCNTADEQGKARIGRATAVGTYPDGASPSGAQDMAGNVREWCSSLYKPYPYSQSDGRENLSASGHRVLRGGSWNNLPRIARAAARYDDEPQLLFANWGFRAALSRPV